MHKYKLPIILAGLAGYGLLCAFGPPVPGAPGRLAMAEYGIMAAIPVGLFIRAILAFNAWHRGFHRRMINGDRK